MDKYKEKITTIMSGLHERIGKLEIKKQNKLNILHENVCKEGVNKSIFMKWLGNNKDNLQHTSKMFNVSLKGDKVSEWKKQLLDNFLTYPITSQVDYLKKIRGAPQAGKGLASLFNLETNDFKVPVVQKTVSALKRGSIDMGAFKKFISILKKSNLIGQDEKTINLFLKLRNK